MKMASVGMMLVLGICLAVLAVACEEGDEEVTATATIETSTSADADTPTPEVRPMPTLKEYLRTINSFFFSVEEEGIQLASIISGRPKTEEEYFSNMEEFGRKGRALTQRVQEQFEATKPPPEMKAWHERSESLAKEGAVIYDGMATAAAAHDHATLNEWRDEFFSLEEERNALDAEWNEIVRKELP